MKKNSLVEDTLFQINNLENVIKENAQGILQSTMKEEIKSLVKESLMEQSELAVGDEDEAEGAVEPMDDTQDFGGDDDMMADDEMMADDDMMADDEMMSDDDETIDMTDATPEEVLKVFKAMGDEDGIIVKKEDNMIHLTDDDNEYLIKLNESMRELEYDDFDDEIDLDDDDFKIPVKPKRHRDHDRGSKFGKHHKSKKFDMDLDDLELDEYDFGGHDLYEEDPMVFEMDGYEDLNEMEDDMSGAYNPEDTIYEIELGDDGDDSMSGMFDDDLMNEMFDDEDNSMFDDEDEVVYESKSFKAKGMGMGSPSKFKYNKRPNLDKGFDEDMKEGPKHKFTGKAKFEYKEEVNSDGKLKPTSKRKETKEASRTLGNGKRFGRMGLDKPKAAPRHLRVESTEELHVLRNKNEEYRKALDLFRNKLNEVAVFNSNLAYATRLFTEHSTTKQEKLNILKKFDNIETLKESKNLYQSIKGELSEGKSESSNITESIERTVSKAPTNGSAVNLIESKTYENPQFLRMKDLMTKIK